jgi:vancomycin resistance protein YoaR
MIAMNSKYNIKQIALKVGLSLAGGVVLFSLVVGLLAYSYRAIYKGRVYPGIYVGWINLSGQNPTGAAELLRREFDYPGSGEIILQYDDLSWPASPAELGLFFSPNYNAEEAFKAGREGNFFQRVGTQIKIIRHGLTLQPVFVLDEETGTAYLESIASEVNQPVVEASLKLEGLDVVVQPGQIGRDLDIPASLEVAGLQMGSLQSGSIPLIVNETYPDILDVSAQADLARQILSQPLVLRIPEADENDPGPWTIPPEQLVEMMIIERVSTENGEDYRIALDSDQLRTFLKDKKSRINRASKNARMYFDDDTQELVLIEVEQIGLKLDLELSILEVQDQLAEGNHDIALVVERTIPAVTAEHTAEDLGITELLNAETTYFFYSDAGRINNIATAAAKFHGVFIAPGETFSMAEQLGDVSLDEGYSEAWIILGDRTIKGVGGGVCQVSTTLFRTVFFAGLPVVERYPHAYRVRYYEQTAVVGQYNQKLAGLDATVYVPLVDFKFTNDTNDWLLMETYVYGAYRQLVWKFYGTSDGRTVDWSTTGLTKVKDPPDPIYEENPDLAKGEIKQVDWAVKGATVTITRDVFRDGYRLWQDTFRTKYQPWAAICQYGPGTKNFPPENPDPDDPCAKPAIIEEPIVEEPVVEE